MSIVLKDQAPGKDFVESVIEKELFCIIEQIVLRNEKPKAKILTSKGVQSAMGKIGSESIHRT